MRFMYPAAHSPRVQNVHDLLHAMLSLGLALKEVPGMLEAAAWQERGGQRIVATSL